MGTTLVIVGVVAILVGALVGWGMGRATNSATVSAKGRQQLEAFQGRVDQAFQSILKPLGQGGSFIAFADLMTDADAFAAGDLKADTFRSTASNASAAAAEALSTLQTIPINDVVDSLPDIVGQRIGFAKVQLEQAMTLYKSAADLFVLASQTQGQLSNQLMAQARDTRLAADDALRAAFVEYNGSLREAGVTPTYKGEPAAPVGTAPADQGSGG